MNTQELFAAIECELYEQCPDCLGNGFGDDGDVCPNCDGGEIIENAKGRAALAELKQRVADLEAFYQHMVSADLQNNHLEYLFNEMMKAGLRDPFEPHDETTAWSEYNALLDGLKS